MAQPEADRGERRNQALNDQAARTGVEICQRFRGEERHPSNDEEKCFSSLARQNPVFLHGARLYTICGS